MKDEIKRYIYDKKWKIAKANPDKMELLKELISELDLKLDEKAEQNEMMKDEFRKGLM